MAANPFTMEVTDPMNDPQPQKYETYLVTIMRPLHPESVSATMRFRGKLRGGGSGRSALEKSLMRFVAQLRLFVTGCDDRWMVKSDLRRARSIESQLSALSETVFVRLLRASVVSPEDVHAIWYGFSLIRGWRDPLVPQGCLLQMVRGFLAELCQEQAEQWTNHALTWELACPEVYRAISVSAWPPLCELLGRLPDCATPAELQEALWHQSFVENPTHAPDHRNYQRFAALAAQLVAIGVELGSDRVETLVQLTLQLDRPWRDRRDLLNGILSAASVEARQRVIKELDRRFEEHNGSDDFEIVCGIAEVTGVEIPRHGAVRRCALRRWARDPKRGGALPAATLIDFVDADVAICIEVAAGLRQRGRVAEAALLLARLPQDGSLSRETRRMVDVSNGDAELARLCQILSMDGDNMKDRCGIFGPVEENAMRLPFRLSEDVCFADTAQAAADAAARLYEACSGGGGGGGAPLLALGLWKEEAPFWYSPVTLFAMCAEDRVELFDMIALQKDNSGGWPEAANQLRALLSDRSILKVSFKEGMLQLLAHTLGLGIANSLKRGVMEPLGPALDLRGIMGELLGRPGEEQLGCQDSWLVVARRVLGLRLCSEDAGSNWARRPLRSSQLHHASVEAWSQLPVLRATCACGIVAQPLARKHLCPMEKPTLDGTRARLAKGHAVGQLAPAGRSANKASTASRKHAVAQAARGAEHKSLEEADLLPTSTRIAVLLDCVRNDATGSGEFLPVVTPVDVPAEAHGSPGHQQGRPADFRLEQEAHVSRATSRSIHKDADEAERIWLAEQLLDGVYNAVAAKQILEHLYAAQEAVSGAANT